ncbi:polyphosphate polymerase domain-containing protein [Corynebacterium oculi]|uniref:VTC domain protein n=1 Tax=Corynebacterium oculi TaxID=1544416 RepID=A0A0Q0YCD1_9CORY|nr:polyphosphate polymerase domain-containing protein [Corynebacterium oculi]KQB83820.1 VTC domain protein [Corynebacterium oculi]
MTSTVNIMEGLAPITLEEINAEAAMLTRVDRKYVMHATQLAEVLRHIPQDTRVLEIAGVRQQRYRTVYFDTDDLLSYRMTAQKRRRRFKVRTRVYQDTEVSFCEIKTAGPRGLTVKQRVPIEVAEALENMVPQHTAAWVDATLGAARVPTRHRALRPVLFNQYRRTTLCPNDLGRATIDTDIAFGHGAASEAVRGFGIVYIETKSGNSPSRLDRVLWSLGHRPARVSKFGTGMAALNPGLAYNRWTPIMREYYSH